MKAIIRRLKIGINGNKTGTSMIRVLLIWRKGHK